MRWASKSFSIEQSDPRIPLKKSTFSTGCSDRIGRSKKKGFKRHFFDCVRMPDVFRPETDLFDPQIRLHNNWPRRTYRSFGYGH